MISHLNLQDWRNIAHYMGMLIILMAFMMTIPFVLGLFLQEYEVSVIFLKCMGITLCTGAVLMLFQVRKEHLDWRQALMVTALSWVVLSFFGTLPLWMSGHYATFLDAFFEGVSGLTASGLTTVLDIDHMALSMNTWRFILHLMGGIGVLVIAMALGVFGSGSSVASLYNAEGRSDHVMPEVKQTSRFIARVSAIIIAVGSVVCFVPMAVAGQSPLKAAFSAVWTTISAYATGGMVGSSTGIMIYHSWPLEVITMLIMAFGVINFTLYGDIWRGRIQEFFRDIEIKTLAIWITVMVTLISFALVTSNQQFFSSADTLVRRALYLVVSAATNTGFTTTYSGQVMYAMGSGALFVIIMSMIIGGSASSTTGGIKAFRLGIISKAIAQTVREALAPDKVVARTFYYHQGRKLLSADLASSALTIFMLYIMTFAIGAIVGIAFGYDALEAIFESVSAASNAGLSSGIVGAGMPEGLEAVYIGEMLLGRLEFIALFAMLVQVLMTFSPKQKAEKGRKERGKAAKEKLLGRFASVALTLMLVGGLTAMALPQSALAVESSLEMSLLTNRYASIDALDTSADTGDAAVTATRIGVLTAVNCALDTATVSFTGEVIGDVMRADSEHVWVNVQGSSGSVIGVYMAKDDADKIVNGGDYATTGSTLQITGVYSVACPSHQGELDVHATSVTLTDTGGFVTHAVNYADMRQGICLVVAGFALMLLFWLLRRRIEKIEWKEGQESRWLHTDY